MEFFVADAAELPSSKGLAGPGLLANVLVRKYADHLPGRGGPRGHPVMALPGGATNVLVDPLAARCYARHTVVYAAEGADIGADATVERYAPAFVQPIVGVDLFLVHPLRRKLAHV